MTAAHCCTGEEKVSVKMYFGYNPDRIKLDEAVNSIFTVVVPKTGKEEIHGTIFILLRQISRPGSRVLEITGGLVCTAYFNS